MSENNQKIKLLKILEFLRTESNKDNPVTTKQIISYLNSIGTTCDRRTLYRDMDVLIENSVDIIKTEYGRENAYYIDNENMTLAELKILIDAVQAANFITDSKSEVLIEKLSSMAGVRKKEIIKENIIFYNNHKHSNEGIYNNIEQIERAIQKKQQISFYYFDLDESCRRAYRKDKARYFTDPVAMVYSEDNYYLMAYSRERNKIINYRVDRMEKVMIEDTPTCEEARIRKRNAVAYSEQVFKMYNGDTAEITLEFEPKLANVIFDKFGENTKISITANNKYKTVLTVQISPPFWGWLFQFVGEMRITSPDNIKEEYHKRLQAALNEEEQ
ncbi:MAG: WYL domain-containing transcriptional regulator [Oscillospiraceae bacterium]|nr:WYL domain-containing transcriptional regulator [Oscillospiraceae bacterium]